MPVKIMVQSKFLTSDTDKDTYIGRNFKFVEPDFTGTHREAKLVSLIITTDVGNN